MADTPQHDLGIGHPAPQRQDVSMPTMLFILLAPPIVWIAEQLVGFGFTSYICYTGKPYAGFATVPGWLQPVVTGANLAGLIVGIAGIALAAMVFRRTGGEYETRSGDAIEAGEGRTRVMAVWALAGSVILVIAMAMNTFSLFLVPLCRA